MRILISLWVLLVVGSTVHAADIRLSAAASMTNAVRDLVTAFQQHEKDVRILPNMGGSGALAKQITQGAPADLYIPANPKWMDYLVQQGFVSADQVRNCAYNALVVVGPRGKAFSSLSEVAELPRIALGSPRSVPAGHYAQQALQAAGVWKQVQSRLVLAKDVRYALAYAERGEVDAAFVYQTDALLAQNSAILLTVSQALYPRVTYPAALTREGQGNPAAVAFFSFLATDEAQQILVKHGFVIDE